MSHLPATDGRANGASPDQPWRGCGRNQPTMTQHLTDFGKRYAGGDHLGRRGVTQPGAVRRRSPPVRPAELPQHPPRSTTAGGAGRAPARRRRGRRAGPAAPGGDSVTARRLRRQRNPFDPVAFASQTSSAARQSMPSRSAIAAPPGRRPRRTISINIAKSRRPMLLRRSHAANRRVTRPPPKPAVGLPACRRRSTRRP